MNVDINVLVDGGGDEKANGERVMIIQEFRASLSRCYRQLRGPSKAKCMEDERIMHLSL